MRSQTKSKLIASTLDSLGDDTKNDFYPKTKRLKYLFKFIFGLLFSPYLFKNLNFLTECSGIMSQKSSHFCHF